MKAPAKQLADLAQGPLVTEGLETLARYLNREPTPADLNNEIRNKALLSQVDAGTPPADVRRKERGIQRLWKAAFQAEITKTPPAQRRFHLTFDMRPGAPWSPDERDRIMAAASEITANNQSPYLPTGVKRADYWRCFLQLTQETRLLKGPLEIIRFGQVDLERKVLDLKYHPHVGYRIPISAAAVALIRAIELPRRDILLEFSSYRHCHSAPYCRVLAAAGVAYRPGGQPKRKEGT